MTNARSLANFATGIGTEGAVLTVDNTNNRIGIATTNPQNDLQVGLGITMEGDLGNVTFLGIVTASSYEGDGSNLTGITAGYWEQTDAGISTISSRVGVGTTNPYNVLTGKTLSIGDGTNSSEITFLSANSGALWFGDGTTGNAAIAGYLEYSHPSDFMRFGTAAEERLRILSDGKVGVGTTVPASIMHIHDDSASTNVLFQASAGTNNAFFGMRGSSAYKAISANDAYIYQNGQNIAFQADHAASVIKFAAGGNQEQVRIASNGDVGIGTNTIAFSNGSGLEIVRSGTACVRIEGNGGNHALEAYADSNGATLDARGSSANLMFDIGGTERVRINSSGHVGINTTVSGWESGADTTALQIDGASVSCINDTDLFTASNAYWDGSNWKYIQTGAAVNYYHYSTGRQHIFRSAASGTAGNNISWTNQLVIDIAGNLNITGIATATQFDATSDIALKENIEVIDEPITKISELKGVTFDWKAGGHSVGVIAQDVEKVLPTAVGGSKDQKTVNYNAIIGLLVESVKDQQRQIEELKSLLDK